MVQPAIDWEELMRGYNDKYKKQYTDVVIFLKESLLEMGSMSNLADTLGVSRSAMKAVLVNYKVPHTTKSAIPPKQWKALAAIPDERLIEMTAKDVAKKLRIPLDRARWMLRRTDRQHKKLVAGRYQRRRSPYVEAR